jgi:hypothetical protein
VAVHLPQGTHAAVEFLTGRFEMKTIGFALFLLSAQGGVTDEPSTPTLVPLVRRPRDVAASPEREPPHPLLRLTAPPHKLPEGCRLAPKSGLEAHKANPMLLTEPRDFGFIHLLIVGSDEALDDVFQRPYAEEYERTVERLMAERTTNVDAAYAAWYEEGDGSRSIGVYALRFRRPLTDAAVNDIVRNDPNRGLAGLWIVTHSAAIVAWTNAKEGAPDLGCFNAVRQHLQHANVE